MKKEEKETNKKISKSNKKTTKEVLKTNKSKEKNNTKKSKLNITKPNKKQLIIGTSCLVVLLVLIVIFIVTFKEKKDSLSVEEFNQKAKYYQYIVTDVKGSYLKQEYIKEASQITGPGDWKIEFLVIKDEETAKTLFAYNKSYFELAKKENDVMYQESYRNYEYYTLTTETSYIRLCRIGSTMLYAFEDVEYKDQIRAFANKTGY